MVIYRGWARSGDDTVLFEAYTEDLQEGDTLHDYSGREWVVDVIIDDGERGEKEWQRV